MLLASPNYLGLTDLPLYVPGQLDLNNLEFRHDVTLYADGAANPGSYELAKELVQVYGVTHRAHEGHVRIASRPPLWAQESEEEVSLNQRCTQLRRPSPPFGASPQMRRGSTSATGMVRQMSATKIQAVQCGKQARERERERRHAVPLHIMHASHHMPSMRAMRYTRYMRHVRYTPTCLHVYYMRHMRSCVAHITCVTSGARK